MYNDSGYNWYDWQAAQPKHVDMAAAWIIAGVILALLLLI